MLSAVKTRVISVTAGCVIGSSDPRGAAAACLIAYAIESVKESSVLTLSEAQESGLLQEFIAEQEAAGIGPADRADFSALLSELIKAPRSKDQTSRFASGGNSSETKTPQDTDQDASD